MTYNIIKNYSKIQTLTASNSASISFTTGINTNYQAYLVRIRGAQPNNNQDNLQIQYSVNAGSSYVNSGYQWSAIGAIGGGSFFATGNASAAAALISDSQASQGTATGAVDNCDIIFYNLATANSYNTFIAMSVLTPGGLLVENITAAGMLLNASAVNAIRFTCNTGNISAGTFILYGIAQGGIYT